MNRQSWLFVSAVAVAVVAGIATQVDFRDGETFARETAHDLVEEWNERHHTNYPMPTVSAVNRGPSIAGHLFGGIVVRDHVLASTGHEYLRDLMIHEVAHYLTAQRRGWLSTAHADDGSPTFIDTVNELRGYP